METNLKCALLNYLPWEVFTEKRTQIMCLGTSYLLF